MTDTEKNQDKKNVSPPQFKRRIVTHLPLIAILMFNFFWLQIPSMGNDSTGLSYDSVFFLKMAYHLLHFGEFGWIGYHEPCFYPIVTALLSLLGGTLLQAGIMVSKLSAWLMVLMTYLLARMMFNLRIAIASALLLTSMPHLTSNASAAMSESLYIFLLTLSIYLLWKVHKTKNILLSVLTGAIFSFAYLTRSEGFLVLIFLLAVISLIEGRRSGFRIKFFAPYLIVFLSFLAVSSPYMVYLKSHYGVWTLGTKTSSIYFWVRERAFHDPDPDRTEWGLSPKGELNIISMTSKDLIDYWLKDPKRSMGVYLKNLKEEVPGFIPKSSATYNFPQVYPVYFAVFLLAGVLITWKRGGSLVSEAYLAAPFMILLVFPLLTGGWSRYLFCYLPFYIILSSSGLNRLCEEFVRIRSGPSRHDGSFVSGLVLCLSVLILALYHFSFSVGGGNSTLPAEVMMRHNEKELVAAERKAAADWANSRFPIYSNYMADWTQLPYYLEGKWTAKPDASINDIVKYAKKNNVDYIIFETNDVSNYERLRLISRDLLEHAGTYVGKKIFYFAVFMKIKK